MKSKLTLLLTSFVAFILISFSYISSPQQSRMEVEALGTATTTLPNSIDVTPLSDSDIRSYYSALDALSTSERQGTNLLKNLKPILSNNFHYYPYTTIIWKIYKITDRDWIQSPLTATELQSYYPSYEANDDPYWVLLYRNDNYTPTAAKSSGTKGVVTDREHVWPQSRGFKASSGATGPAGTDIHHLMAGDSRNNQNGHSNYPWGDERLKKAGTTGILIGDNDYNKTGYRWTVTNANNQDDFVYEPQDSDKGNIARAIFYMAARYNNWAGASGAISAFEPFLNLTNDIYESGSSISSTDSTPATMGVRDLLMDWHLNDPVDAYEIKRNNLIYKNFQFNRNPFIDFPEWAEAIYGNEGKYATPATDRINGYNNAATVLVESLSLSPSSTTLYVNGGTQTITPTVLPANATNKNVSWSTTHASVATVSNGVITPVGIGTATISATTLDGSNLSQSVSVTVNADPGKIVDYLTLSGVTTSAPFKSTYPMNDISVTAHYTNLTSEDVTANAILGSPDMSQLGEQSMEVSYGGSSTTYSVFVTNQNAIQHIYPTEPIISEYIEGSSSNKYIEIYNGTALSIDLANYRLGLYTNGASTASYSSMTGTLASGATIVYKNSLASLTLNDGVVATVGGATTFNGNDAIALNKISTNTNVDIFGQIGVDPGSAWTASGYSTVDRTLRRKSSINQGRTTNGVFDPSIEWDVFAIDTATGLGSHTMILDETFTDLEQATAFASYVMFGIGKNAQGLCSETYETLSNEYNFMNSDAQNLFDTNSSQEITGLNESNQSITVTFVEARQRMAYLSQFASIENLEGLMNQQALPQNIPWMMSVFASLVFILVAWFLSKKTALF